MAVISKLTPLYYSCYEIGHTWTPHCRNAAFDTLVTAWSSSFKIYAAVYLLSYITKWKRLKKKEYQQVIMEYFIDVLQSTIFLSFNAAGAMAGVCVFRNALGFINFYTGTFLPAFISSLVCIYIENAKRRGILALYTTNVATETAFRMLLNRDIVKPYGNWETWIFALTSSILLYKLKCGKLPQIMDKVTKLLLSTYESPLESIQQNETHSANDKHEPTMILNISFILHTFMYIKSINDKIITYIQGKPKHISCQHPHSCIHYIVQGLPKLFLCGWSLEVMMSLIKSYNLTLKNPYLIKKIIFKKSNISLGLFLVGFRSCFKLICCALRWLRGKDSVVHAFPAGLIAGCCFKIWPNDTVALYLMWKVLQILYDENVEEGKIPHYPILGSILYALSIAFLFHCTVFEPHIVKPSYYKFLEKIGRVNTINRQILDSYGVYSSYLFPNFWPDYDETYLTTNMKHLIASKRN